LALLNVGESLQVSGDIRVVGPVGSCVDLDRPGESGHGCQEIAPLGADLSEPAQMHGQMRTVGAQHRLTDP
jgi:hypothetical protein